LTKFRILFRILIKFKAEEIALKFQIRPNQIIGFSDAKQILADCQQKTEYKLFVFTERLLQKVLFFLRKLFQI